LLQPSSAHLCLNIDLINGEEGEESLIVQKMDKISIAILTDNTTNSSISSDQSNSEVEITAVIQQ
jgi:hypothetical protein